jgi:hypothetical protein
MALVVSLPRLAAAEREDDWILRTVLNVSIERQVTRLVESQLEKATAARRSGVQMAATTSVDAVEANYVIQVRYCLAKTASSPDSVNCGLLCIAYVTYLD